MSIFWISFGRDFPEIKDFEAKGTPEILKKSSKTGDQFTAISNIQNNE